MTTRFDQVLVYYSSGGSTLSLPYQYGSIDHCNIITDEPDNLRSTGHGETEEEDGQGSN
jgi:hypothetical protein